MPTITIPSKPIKQVLVPLNCNLFEALNRYSVPVGTACRGAQICGKCIVLIDSNDGLSEETEAEKERKRKNNIPNKFRLSCFCTVRGNVKLLYPSSD